MFGLGRILFSLALRFTLLSLTSLASQLWRTHIFCASITLIINTTVNAYSLMLEQNLIAIRAIEYKQFWKKKKAPLGIPD